jgi:hypothetical protein
MRTVNEGERVHLLRGIVRFPFGIRPNTMSVGTPAGVHYSYDLEGAGLLWVWKGPFLDVASRPGLVQYDSQPPGVAVRMGGKVLLTQFPPVAEGTAWPDRPIEILSYRGYHLEANGQPVFRYALPGFTVTDRIAPAIQERGLTRTIRITGRFEDRDAVVLLLAQGSAITHTPDGSGYVIGDREYYIDWHHGSGSGQVLQPSFRYEGDTVQLIVRVPTTGTAHELTYSIVW